MEMIEINEAFSVVALANIKVALIEFHVFLLCISLVLVNSSKRFVSWSICRYQCVVS